MTTHEHDVETQPRGDDVRQPDAGVRQDGQTGDAAGESPVGAPAASTALFGGNELDGLRARWDSVQAKFVDDPRQCVQWADDLVADVVAQLTTSFAEARTGLEQQWARGEQASTEDLRLALKQYREFFERLLAV
jgi:hypothetical protein